MPIKYKPKSILKCVCYTKDEVLSLFNGRKYSKTSMTRWLKLGLPLCNKSLPQLIYGENLIQFFNKRNMDQNKRKSDFGEFYCLTCKEQHFPLDNKVSIDTQGNRIKVLGLCPYTGNKMFRFYAISDMDKIQSKFNITSVQRLMYSRTPVEKERIKKIQVLDEQEKNSEKIDWAVTNPSNERAKYNYRLYLSKARARDAKTWQNIMKDLRRFETFNKFSDFININPIIVSNFIEHITKNYSLNLCAKCVRSVREFYIWLSNQNKYQGKIDYNTIGYFQLTRNQMRIASSSDYQQSYELDEIRQIISNMPQNTDMEMRNIAIVSLQALCGLRISELRTIKFKNLIFDKPSKQWFIYINPKDVEVKFAKTRHAYFMPFDKAWMDNVLRWRERLIELGWKNKDPLFPTFVNKTSSFGFQGGIPQKIPFKDNSIIIYIFRNACNDAGARYLNLHSFRHMIARWAASQSPEMFNAVSQSLGHTSMRTTFEVYGKLSPEKVGQIFMKLEDKS